MDDIATKYANRIISDAATRILASCFPRVKGRRLADYWLAVRAWVALSAPRPPVLRYSHQACDPRREKRRGALRGINIEYRDPAELKAVVAEAPLPMILSDKDERLARLISTGHTYSEIAATLGTSVSGVARQVADLKRRLA